MTPALLREAGEALYGPRWQADLARDLGVADRTVRRWLAGSSAIPPKRGAELRRLCREHAAQLRKVAAE